MTDLKDVDVVMETDLSAGNAKVAENAPNKSDFQSAKRRMELEDQELKKKAMKEALDDLINGDDVTDEQKAIATKEFADFQEMFNRYLIVKEGRDDIVWSKIQHVSSQNMRLWRDLIPPKTDTPEDKAAVKAMLDKLIVVKLNGGLGTSMGCVGPKSIIVVRQETTFLDLVIQQISALNERFDCNIPLVLLNSFNTAEHTAKIIKNYVASHVDIRTFNQSKYPRFDRDTKLPIASSLNSDNDDWYPPGHGDIYQSFYNSGLLKQFLTEGKEYMFCSNVDNLGATVDLSILKYLLQTRESGTEHEFMMELTDKTIADIKGGTLISYNNKLRLLEAAQVPKQYMDEFKSVRKFRVFNTNNFWAGLKAVERLVEKKALSMEIIINPKTTDKGRNIIQLETACGAAMKCFAGAVGINVPRSRFLPVKTTSDLLGVMSSLYEVKDGALVMSEKRAFPQPPLVKLGSQFKKVANFLNRFASIPNVLELDHLTVSGDVWFGKDVTLRGTVIVIANHGDRIDIPPGSILENKIISGNLRILDH